MSPVEWEFKTSQSCHNSYIKREVFKNRVIPKSENITRTLEIRKQHKIACTSNWILYLTHRLQKVATINILKNEMKTW